MGIEQLKVMLNDSMGSDLSVVNAARVSFDKASVWNVLFLEDEGGNKYCEWELFEKDEKLIHYLAKHKHLSPFGHCFASFTIEAPVFVARQLVKHKFLRMNEVSRRYVDTPPVFYVPKDWRGKSPDKKQGSEGTVAPTSLWGFDVDNVYDDLYSHYSDSLDLYNHLLREGVAPEMARIVLPQSMMTQWWWSGSLDAFAAMCVLRCKEDTQWETRQIADQISKEMEALFPVSWRELMANG